MVLTDVSCGAPGYPREPIFHGDYSFNTGQVKQFTGADYVSFGVTVLISFMIGLYQAVRNKFNISLNDYLMAGHSMSAVPVALSLLATTTSTISLMGNPGEIYDFNTMWFWYAVGDFFTLAATAHLYVPVFYQLNFPTVYKVNMI